VPTLQRRDACERDSQLVAVAMKRQHRSDDPQDRHLQRHHRLAHRPVPSTIPSVSSLTPTPPSGPNVTVPTGASPPHSRPFP